MKIILSRDSLIALLEDIGVELHSETGRDIIAYCPFHVNRDSPALNISKEPPYPWRCWNAACSTSGSLLRMIELMKSYNPMQALRFMYKYKSDEKISYRDIIYRHIDEGYEPWPEEKLDVVRYDYSQPHKATDYMLQRGFTLDTLKYFQIGFSEKRNRVVIPVRDEEGSLVGFSGRAVDPGQEPKYWDKDLPKRYVLFNLNNAKNYSEVIVTEGPFDAMKVHQAGFPNVVALLGGAFTGEKQSKLTRTFSSCIIFTDNPEMDETGAALIEKISEVMKKAGRDCFVAKYPPERKDPGEMSKEEITQAIQEKESILRFRLRLGGK